MGRTAKFRVASGPYHKRCVCGFSIYQKLWAHWLFMILSMRTIYLLFWSDGEQHSVGLIFVRYPIHKPLLLPPMTCLHRTQGGGACVILFYMHGWWFLLREMAFLVHLVCPNKGWPCTNIIQLACKWTTAVSGLHLWKAKLEESFDGGDSGHLSSLKGANGLGL